MSRRSEGQLFVGRLCKNIRVRDLEDIFEPYGRMIRCEVKYGAEMAYAFVDFEDRRDAEDALRYENGRDILGSSIIVEWAKGNPRRPVISRQRENGMDECYRCHRPGHWARDCPDDRGNYGFRRPGRGGGGGGGGGGRYRSPSPRRRKRSRSRSRSRDRRRRSRSNSHSRSRSTSRDRRRRTRSNSRDRKKTSRRRSRSPSKSKSRSRSKSAGRSPSKSRSRSPKSASPEQQLQQRDERNSRSRSKSMSD